VLGHGIRADPKSFFGERWRTDSATNLWRKALDSCKLFIYIYGFWGLPQTPTGALPWTPLGDFCPPRSPVPTLTSESGYATGQNSALSWRFDPEVCTLSFNTYSTDLPAAVSGYA